MCIRDRNPTARGINNLVLTEIFPAGWEILNTRCLNDGATDKTATGIKYQDIRDDKVYSYIDYLPSGRQVTLKINLCAVYPGRFYLPPVYCEAMYDNLCLLYTSITRQVEISSLLPDVRFVGQGVIIPQSTQLLVPFQAVYLRGVVVRVITILEQNIGQFLQVNNLDGTSDLMLSLIHIYRVLILMVVGGGLY